MDTKSKNPKKWTAHKAVKITSFALIIVLCCVVTNRALSIAARFEETRVSPEIVLTDLSTNQYFFEQNMATARHNALLLLFYKSEASIEAGEHLQWVRSEGWHDDWYARWDGDGDSDGGRMTIDYNLWDKHFSIFYGMLDERQDTPENRAAMEQSAIRRQLGNFRAAQEYLDGLDGLIYYIGADPIEMSEDSENQAARTLVDSNVDASRQNAEFFRSQPVYFVMENGTNSWQSHDANLWFEHGPTHANYNTIVCVAFTADAVNAFNSTSEQARMGYLRDVQIIAASAVAMVALLVLLLFGAGRKYGSEDDGVHIALIDRPYLDVTLVALIGWILLVLFVSIEPGWSIRRHNNMAAMNMLLATAAVLALTPTLLWLQSFAKRIKAGRFWRHTLIYALPSKLLRFCARHSKSLWVRSPLTAKVAAVAVASFCAMLIVGILAGARLGGFFVLLVSLLFSAAVAYLLLRYAGRIRKLEQGAHDASGGIYDVPIEVGGGELGRIAESINNISAGINTAVEQRMKSERLKTELITNVSHDIRTPLTSIITYTDLLKHEGLDCEKAPEYLDVLVQKSQRLKTLTDELFEAAKAATGNIDVNLAELDIVSLINQVLGELDSAIKASSLDLRVNLPERLMVKADGKLMWRVLDNLLSNVFKYALPGSRVYLDVKQNEDTQSFAQIDLKNISAEELNVDPAELTERFKRGDDSRADGGSGLGLSIVQSFVSAQGGRFAITVDGDLFKATVMLPELK